MLKKLPTATEQAVDLLCEHIWSSGQNWLFAQVGTERLRLTRRLRILYHGLRGKLQTMIIRPNDILMMDRDRFDIFQHALIGKVWGMMGISYRLFCNVRSEPNGNLVVEWV